ncbi:MAG: permease prefix domain 2-containing transporter, partial [Bacteroidota bacterium]
MKKSPPNWANRFLRWFCRPEYLEEIEGDLLEIFHLKANSKSLPYAKQTYLLDVLKFFRWSNFKYPQFMKSTINFGLLGHNLKITSRVFRRNLLYSGINLSGLILGVTAFTFLFIYHSYEKSFDKHFSDNERVYRIALNSIDGG